MSALVRNLVLSALLALVAAAPSFAEVFASNNVMLIELIPLGAFPSNPSSANDCWGYVSPSGREYALMGLRDAVAVVDITDPSGAVIVASIPHQSSNWCDIKTYGTYAYAVNETGGGLDVIDLSQVDAGIVTLVQRVTEGGLSTCHNLAVDETSGYLYLCQPNINQGRLVAMDLTDPANPVIAGVLPIADGFLSHDAQVVTYESGPYQGMQICFSASGSDGIEIYDVTDKSAISVIATATYPNFSYTHQNWLTDDRQYLYVNDELDNVNETVIFDVSNIFAPTFISSYTAGVTATDHNVFYHQGRVYEAEYRAGMRVFDAADPLNPVQIGWIDTFPGDDSPGSGGVWGVYPFFPSGKILASDKNRGLFILWPDVPPLTFTLTAGDPPSQVHPDGYGFDVQIDAVAGQVLDPASPVLVYDFGQGEVETAMNMLGGGAYEAVFGPIPCGALVQFHLRAATIDGIAVRSPIEAPCGAYIAVAAVNATIVIQDDLAVGTGWIAGLPGDTAVEGIWTLVDPVGTAAQPEVDHTSTALDTCFVTGQGLINEGIGVNDVDQGFTTLISPKLDLSQAPQATVAYWRWFHNSFFQIDADEGNAPSLDVLRVSISPDNGETWVPVETVGPSGSETSGGWILHAFDAGALIPLTNEVRLRFVAEDVGNLSIVEVGIDDLLVYSIGCTETPWQDLGDGLAGTNGVPSLEGTGTLVSGDPVSLALSDALANSTTSLVIGYAAVNVPFKGGVLVPNPDVLVLGLPTDGAGGLLLASTWPNGIPPNTTLYFQHWVQDPAGPKGLSASNGLSGTTP